MPDLKTGTNVELSDFTKDDALRMTSYASFPGWRSSAGGEDGADVDTLQTAFD